MINSNPKKEKRFKAMFDISLSSANRIYAVASAFAIIGAVFTLGGVIGAIWSGSIRERFANERISNNEKETATAKAVAAKANERTAELENEAAKTALQLEKEKMQRLELEQAVAPRIMEQYQSSNALKKFSNVTAIISSIPDIEARRTAAQINATLNMAGWKTKLIPFDPQQIFQDGVIVERNVGAISKDDISGDAADELIKQLQASKIESHTMPAMELPNNTIFIKVGFKPYQYFSDKMLKDGKTNIFGNMLY
ncbi:MAG: hypothetical protein PHS93_09795 [Candidatus Omnitrophica bacterium]|nr:hypothetical protein [Candidatus Omnitrophota bacterium]MDD5353441.1 hypothetical protein [Candidatus Omnitrophota bacterium]MDD5551446.1 hypothetical protein [Candidatus Omnitrophota bacterium]